MNCPTCNYPKTDKGCETPGCPDSIWMTDEVRQARAREAEERAERERIMKIRSRMLHYDEMDMGYRQTHNH